MPKKMTLLHRIFWNAIKDDVPEKLEELGKPEVAKVIASIKEKHTGNPEAYKKVLQTAYSGLLIFDQAVRESPNKFDDAGLDIFLDPIREAAEREGIQL